MIQYGQVPADIIRQAAYEVDIFRPKPQEHDTHTKAL